jgi:hypothetical protein
MLPSGGEFNRLDRDGDYMEGNLQVIEISDPKGSIIEFLTAEFGVMAGGMRLNGPDLEFYDTTLGTWVKLSSLTGQIGDIAHFIATPGQVLFNLPWTYGVGTNTLHMFIGGLRMPGTTFLPTPVYVEASPTTVTINAVAPFTPFVGGELVIFYVAGRPLIADTYLVKASAADANPNALDTKVVGTGAAQVTNIGPAANPQRQVDVPFAIAIPPVSSGVGAVGVSPNVARQDHQHPVPAQNPPLGSAIPIIEGVGSAGVSTNASREDHVHPTGGGGGGTPGHLLYEEQALPALGGPNHTITLATGTYPVAGGALIVNVGGVEWPASLITEISPTQFTINGVGPGLSQAVIARVPLGAAVAGLTNLLYEIQAAAPAQLIFNIATGTYQTGTFSLHVLVNGVLVPNNGVYYNETGPAQVTFLGVAPFVFLGGENVSFIVFNGSSDPAYTPLTPANWVGPVPVTHKQAIDRLAAALVAHTGVPIP